MSNVSKTIICHECKHISFTEERHEEHFAEPRHVNHFRFMAYKDPKRRQMWLKLWFKETEKAEEKNPLAHMIEEQEESTHKMITMQEDLYEHRFVLENPKKTTCPQIRL